VLFDAIIHKFVGRINLFVALPPSDYDAPTLEHGHCDLLALPIPAATSLAVALADAITNAVLDGFIRIEAILYLAPRIDARFVSTRNVVPFVHDAVQ
jgi:hypothetical protein